MLMTLTREVDLVLSAVVLQATRCLPGGRLGSVQKEGYVFVEGSLCLLANRRVEAKERLHFSLINNQCIITYK